MLFYILMEIIPLDQEPTSKLCFALYKSEIRPVLGVVQISHGMAEHMGRYTHFIHFLNDKGFHVAIHDHRGHGQRIIDENFGYFGPSGGWNLLVDDLISIHSWLKSSYSDLPHILLGHSMGSWVSLAALQRGMNLDATLLSGSTKPKPFDSMLQKLLVKFEYFRHGGLAHSDALHKVIFGGFNSKFKDAQNPNDWLSTDRASVDDYTLDPLCGFVVTNQLWLDVIEGVTAVFDPDQLALIPQQMPFLIFSGTDDPVGGMGQGTTALHESLEQAGLNSTLLLIEGARHETLNETTKLNTYNEIVSFLHNNLYEV